jgi:hypothetical protein
MRPGERSRANQDGKPASSVGAVDPDSGDHDTGEKTGASDS